MGIYVWKPWRKWLLPVPLGVCPRGLLEGLLNGSSPDVLDDGCDLVAVQLYGEICGSGPLAIHEAIDGLALHLDGDLLWFLGSASLSGLLGWLIKQCLCCLTFLVCSMWLLVILLVPGCYDGMEFLATTQAAVLGNFVACKQLDNGLACGPQFEPLLVHGLHDVFLWNENWFLLLVCNLHPAADFGHGASKWWQLGMHLAVSPASCTQIMHLK